MVDADHGEEAVDEALLDDASPDSSMADTIGVVGVTVLEAALLHSVVLGVAAQKYPPRRGPPWPRFSVPPSGASMWPAARPAKLSPRRRRTSMIS